MDKKLPFKLGDEVVYVGIDSEVHGKSYIIASIDRGGWCNPCEKTKTNLLYGGYHYSQLMLAEIYNSPLYNAMKEDND